MFDIQVGADNQIEGAWLANAKSPSPVMIVVGQHFGSGTLKRALLNADQQIPEVWMDTGLGLCRATLSEQYAAPKFATKAAPTITAPPETRVVPRLTSSQVELVKRLAKYFPKPIVDSIPGFRGGNKSMNLWVRQATESRVDDYDLN